MVGVVGHILVPHVSTLQLLHLDMSPVDVVLSNLPPAPLAPHPAATLQVALHPQPHPDLALYEALAVLARMMVTVGAATVVVVVVFR